MISILNPFFVWWLRSGRYPWSRFRRRFFESGYLEKGLPAAASLEEIKERLKKVKWTGDGPLHLWDAVSYPETVWDKKKDDCDGFAVLAAALLRKWNPDSKPVLLTVLMWPMDKSHTVCVFHATTGEMWYFDNKTLKQDNYHNYTEIADAVRKQRELICWDVADPETLKTLEFHQPGR